MGSEGMQITIPDFGDEDGYNSPGLFGKPQMASNAFGSGGSSAHAFGHPPSAWGGLEPDSPTITSTPMVLPERKGSYFHARTDSAASEDSSMSAGGFSRTPLAVPSTPKLSGSTPAPTKKSSFASLKNAFVKAGKNNDSAPPLPPLKNPFNRSNASLATSSTVSTRRPSVTATPSTSARPSTPSSGDTRYTRTLAGKPKSHQYARSYQSQTGSVWSEAGSEFGMGSMYRSSSPPPLPPMPNGLFGQRQDGSPTTAYHDEQVTLDPRTPSDYALHAVFMRFATAAETKIDAFLRKPMETDPRLDDTFGLGQDTKFDDLLVSLGKISQKHFKPVVDSIMRWRKSQNDGISNEIVREHVMRSSAQTRTGHQRQASNLRSQVPDPSAALNHRKVLASIYITCRALICIVQAVSTSGTKDALSEATGFMLEETTFEQFRRPDLRLLSSSANHRMNAELYARLLGDLANVRFVSVTDRFISELAPVASGQVAKDTDMRYEMLLRGLKHIQFKVYPPEKFEEGAEFLEAISHSFENAHGFGLKSAFAETLTQLLHPIGKTAQAEVNHPLWAKAIEVIYTRAKDMMTKPRYWTVAYPLVITTICVAPQDYFLKNWVSCFDAGFAKLKEKQSRVPVMNGMIRLLWTYLFRCPEQASVATSKLDALLKKFFPASGGVFPSMDDQLEPFAYIMHFVLARHPEFGTSMVAEFLQEGTILGLGAPPSSSSHQSISSIVSAERFAISVQATLFTIHGVEKEQVIPSWPSSSDFSVFPSASDYPAASELLSDATLAGRPSIKDLVDRVQPLIAKVASWCHASIGHMTIFDDQWAVAHNPVVHEEASNWTVRRHAEGNVCFPISLVPQMNILHTCFQAWPRLLNGSEPLSSTIDQLLLGVLHVEPAIAAVAAPALQRLTEDPEHGSEALSRFNDFLFDTMHKTKDGSGVRSPVESRRLVGLWVNTVEEWIQQMGRMGVGTEVEDAHRRDALLRLDEIETGALLLLSHETWLLHAIGVKVIRLLAPLLRQEILFIAQSSDGTQRPERIFELLLQRTEVDTCLSSFDEHLDAQTLARLDFWRKLVADDVLLRVSEGNNPRDRTIWKYVYPSFLKICAGRSLRPINRLQDLVIGAAVRLTPFVQSVSIPRGRSARPSAAGDRESGRLGADSIAIIHQWAMWERMICSMSGTIDAKQVTGHVRAPSELSGERDKMQTPRGLYKYLAQFLESDHSIFRSAAAVCISLLPEQTYSQLLEDLSLLTARHFYDEPRSKAGGSSFVGRAHQKEELYTAVARIYYLTTHFLQDPRLPNRQAALAHVLKFVRQTQIFLSSPDIRDRFQLQRLRRYFCGTVERLFDGMATLKDSDRFIPPHTHLSLYRLCEEWCQFGTQSAVVKQRLVLMQTKAASASDNPQGMADSIERFQTQTKKLSRAAVHTLASLCHKAYFPPEVSSDSPIERQDQPRSLDPASTLDRITSILASFDDAIRAGAEKALRSLLSSDIHSPSLAEETMRRTFVTTSDPANSNGRFFGIVANVICDRDTHAFTFSQAICLSLTNLCHPVVEIRRHAFRALNAIHRRSGATLSLSQFQAGIQSMSPGTYIYAYRRITDALATAHQQQSALVLAQVTSWMPRILESGHDRLPLLLLQSLEYWISNVDLMVEDTSELSQEGAVALLHLMTLTVRYMDPYAEQITAMWTRLLDNPHQHNGYATIRFLLEQSQKVGCASFATCGSKLFACLCSTSVGPQLFRDLCGVIEPARILPNVEHKLSFPNSSDTDLWATFDILFGDEPRLILGTGQYAMLLLAEVALERPWEYPDHLPVIFHAIFTHLDHRQPFVQQRARHMLFQTLRAWMPAYEELNLDPAFDLISLHAQVASLEADLSSEPWSEQDPESIVLEKMKTLCRRTLALVEPLFPTIAAQWGSLALTWATGCAVRTIAFRSLQLFRAILPPVTRDDLGILVGRLSNTIAGEDEQLQSYSVEILTTLTALCSSSIDPKLLPQLFWCACACLSTTVEQEFVHATALVNVLLDLLDLDDPSVENLLISQRPSDWTGPASLQPALLTGLRSSITLAPALSLLQRLTKIRSNALVDPSVSRLRDLYTTILPWCLQDMSDEQRNPALSSFAGRIAEIADTEERPSISRIMTSFIKARFRTKDDFLRQSVLSLREHFSAEYWAEVVTLLISFVLNGERWLRAQTLQVLKVLFQQKTAKNPVELLGSELLMPLLRLVDSDVASQALEVLEEPMVISGGLAAKHVLRMSMHIAPSTDEISSQGEVFGIPLDSGWCVPQTAEARARCRANVEAVFDTCKSNFRPSHIRFHPEMEHAVQRVDTREDEVSDLVQDLHELSSFFQRESLPARAQPPGRVQMPTQSNVARWAAILAKSTDNPVGVPQTPFLDVFRVDDVETFSDDTDDDSDSGAESDLFYFDSSAFLNGHNANVRTDVHAFAHE